MKRDTHFGNTGEGPADDREIIGMKNGAWFTVKNKEDVPVPHFFQPSKSRSICGSIGLEIPPQFDTPPALICEKCEKLSEMP